MAEPTPTCAVCGLPEGDTSDGLGPLGSLEQCDLCGKLVCPVCLVEADCCFEDADDHDEDPTWAPLGWRRVLDPSTLDQPADAIVWERVAGHDESVS